MRVFFNLSNFENLFLNVSIRILRLNFRNCILLKVHTSALGMMKNRGSEFSSNEIELRKMTSHFELLTRS